MFKTNAKFLHRIYNFGGTLYIMKMVVQEWFTKVLDAAKLHKPGECQINKKFSKFNWIKMDFIIALLSLH